MSSRDVQEMVDTVICIVLYWPRAGLSLSTQLRVPNCGGCLTPPDRGMGSNLFNVVGHKSATDDTRLWEGVENPYRETHG